MSRVICVVCVFMLFVLIQVSLFMSVSGVRNFSYSTRNRYELLYLSSVLKSTSHATNALDAFRDVLESAPSVKTNGSSQCLTDLGLILQGVIHGDIWALKMIDASTKIPSGLLQGNIVDLGEFDECVDIGTSTTPSNIQAQHCLISINLSLNSSLDIGGKGTSDALGNGLTLIFALCLPKSCYLQEIHDAMEGLALIIGRFIPAGDNITITVNPTDCHFTENVPFTSTEWSALVICLILVAVTIMSTTYDWFMDNNRSTNSGDITRKDKLLLSFSVLSNGRKLFNTAQSAESFPVLNCLKVFSIFWVIVGHKYRLTSENPLVNLLELPEDVKYLGNMLILNAALSVDVFFIISGLLATYSYLKVGFSKYPTISTHIVNIIHRYLRLTPAFALMILITATWQYRMGDGPMWDRIVGDAKKTCEVYWWSGLLYINNYYNPDNSCMLQSWYLAADMQLYLFAPLVLYPLLKWPRWGLVLLAICVVFSVAIPFSVAFIEEIKTPIPLSRNQERVRRETDTLYLPTHTRTVSYVIGIFVGYILFQIKVKKVQFKLKKTTNIIIWIVAILLLLLSLFGCYPFFQLDSTYNKWASSSYLGLYRLGWSLGIAWIIIACSTGHGGCITTFVSWSLFAPLGKLTYSVFLVHVAVLLVGLGRMRNPQYFDHYTIITTCFGEFMISLFFATVLTLVMEAPLMVIEKLILHRESNARSTIDLPSRISPSNVGSSQRIRTGHDF